MSLSTLRPKKRQSQRLAQRDQQATTSRFQSLKAPISEGSGFCSHCEVHAHPPSNPYLNPNPDSPIQPNLHPNPYPSHFSKSLPNSSAPHRTSSSNRTRKMSQPMSRQSLRRILREHPEIANKKLSDYGRVELKRFHYRLQLRMMEMHPDRWYDEAFPEPMRPLIKEPFPELVKYVFTNRGALYTTMHKHIEDFKDGKTDVHLIVFKPIPSNMIANDVVWDFNIAPHCRFTYLEGQKTVIVQIAKETRFMESLPSNQLRYDDSNIGVQGHALGRMKYGLKKHLSNMGISEDEYDFLCNGSRKSAGINPVPDDPTDFESIHSCDRMFVPHSDNPKVDAEGNVWPTMVVESSYAHSNVASRTYLESCADWWFTQSGGVTKIVLLMYFDYKKRETIVEKWVRAAESPFNKTLAQTVVINIQPHENITKRVVVSEKKGLTLSLESLMGRPKREGETDIVFEEALLTGFANGYLVPWPNLGPDRKKNILGSSGSSSSGLTASSVATSIPSADSHEPKIIPNISPRVLKAALGPALSRKLAEDVTLNLGTNGTPQYDLIGSTIRVTLNRTNNPLDEKDAPPNATGKEGVDIDKEENKKVEVEISLEKMMSTMSTQDDTD